jgi:hypothetical protein
MKNRRFTPMLIAAGLLSAMNFGSAFAAPDAPPVHKPGKMGRRPAVPKRVIAAIEAKTGKPLTEDQKRQLGEATKARQAAIEAATEKYLADASAATGLSVEDLREITKPAKRGADAPKPDAAAPAPVPAP